MRGLERYSTLPDNADKVLFAEDFLNHILLRFNLPSLCSGIANHRAFIYNAFNSEVKFAASYVYKRLEEEMSDEFENILKQNSADMNAFLKYAIPLKFHTSMLPNEQGAQNFLSFCVKVSTMAAKLQMHGFQDAPGLALEYIISAIDKFDMMDGGRVALNTVAADYSQKFIDMDNYLTPESASDYDYSDSLSTLSSKNSDASRSPDREDEHLEVLSDSDYCNLCIAALSPTEEKPVSSISDSKHVERTDDVKADDNIIRFSEITSDSVSSGSSKESPSSESFHSFEVTSSEDDGSKENIEKKQNMKRSHSKESDSGSDKCETDNKTTDPFDRQKTKKRSDAC